MNEKILGIFINKCLFGIVDLPTKLKDYFGQELFVGDLVLICHKRDLENLEGKSEAEVDAYLKDPEAKSKMKIRPVCKNSYMTLKKGKILRGPEDNGWVFGLKMGLSLEDWYIVKKCSYVYVGDFSGLDKDDVAYEYFDQSNIVENVTNEDFN